MDYDEISNTYKISKQIKIYEVHKYLLGINRNDVYNVETFSAIFNAKESELIKRTEISKRNVSLDNPNSKNPYKKGER